MKSHVDSWQSVFYYHELFFHLSSSILSVSLRCFRCYLMSIMLQHIANFQRLVVEKKTPVTRVGGTISTAHSPYWEGDRSTAWGCIKRAHYMLSIWEEEPDNNKKNAGLSTCRSLSIHCLFNSLWASDAIWRHRSESTLAQVIACCLKAPSHYLNPCWLIISKVQ